MGGMPVSGIHRPASRLLPTRRGRRPLSRRITDRLPVTAARQPPTVHAERQRRLSLPLDGWTVVRGTVPLSPSVGRGEISYCL